MTTTRVPEQYFMQMLWPNYIAYKNRLFIDGKTKHGFAIELNLNQHKIQRTLILNATLKAAKMLNKAIEFLNDGHGEEKGRPSDENNHKNKNNQK
jgi:hypothetical protein